MKPQTNNLSDFHRHRQQSQRAFVDHEWRRRVKLPLQGPVRLMHRKFHLNHGPQAPDLLQPTCKLARFNPVPIVIPSAQPPVVRLRPLCNASPAPFRPPASFSHRRNLFLFFGRVWSCRAIFMLIPVWFKRSILSAHPFPFSTIPLSFK